MSKVEAKKEQAIANIAGYLLAQGFQETGIRALAKVAGTSDRMLIYYFGTKDELLNQVFQSIAAGVTDQLDALLGTHIRPADQLLTELTAVTHHEAFRPAVQLWFELVGLAVRGQEPYASNAKQLAKNWIDWAESRAESITREEAADLYAHLEGRIMLKLIQDAGSL